MSIKGLSRIRVDTNHGNEGLSLIELMVTMSVFLLIIMALGLVSVPLSRQREQIEEKSLILGRTRTAFESLKGANPEFLYSSYNGTVYNSEFTDTTKNSNKNLADNAYSEYTQQTVNAKPIGITVDQTDPKLLRLSISGSLQLAGSASDLFLETEIYNPKG